MNLIPILFLSISANLDTFVVGISYGVKKIKINLTTLLIITFITTVGTFLSMYFGLMIAKIMPLDIANLIGSFLLLAIGMFMVIEYLKKSKSKVVENKSAVTEKVTYCEILEDPIKADKDHSGHIDAKEAVALSIALSINNLSIGVAASIAGINIYINTLFTLIITILSLLIGISVGNSCLSKIFGKYGGLISGIIIILLAFYEMYI